MNGNPVIVAHNSNREPCHVYGSRFAGGLICRGSQVCFVMEFVAILECGLPALNGLVVDLKVPKFELDCDVALSWQDPQPADRPHRRPPCIPQTFPKGGYGHPGARMPTGNPPVHWVGIVTFVDPVMPRSRRRSGSGSPQHQYEPVPPIPRCSAGHPFHFRLP